MNLNEIKDTLRRYGQDHLHGFWDQLSAPQQQRLSAQLQGIDFELISRLATGEHREQDWQSLAARAQSPPAFRLEGKANRFTAEQARARADKALRAGQLGAVLVAGGQGSRLGFAHPKGLYPIGPLSQRTLLQMHIDQLRAIARRYRVHVPLYLMTSPATHAETIEFLRQHHQFGLDEDDLHIFCQGTMPAVDTRTGRLLLASSGEVFLSPDGHGGTLAALQGSGCLDDMQRRGIRQLYYFQVDNPLVSICDPELVGYHLLSESEMTTQVIAKQHPLEKVGNVVMADGRMMVIEYSDLPPEQAERRNPDGSLTFWAGSIAVHVFEVDFLNRMAQASESLPFHRAHKTVPFVDESGRLVTPSEPNVIKFERFIFDLMPAAKNAIVVESAEAETFAPLKNARGAAKDTPETTRQAISDKHKRMLQAIGAQVADGIVVEINPLFALDAAELRRKIESGASIERNTYFDE